jgi:hypothetical protein
MRPLFFVGLLALCFNAAYALSTGRPRVTEETEHFEITVDKTKSSILPEAAAWLERAYGIESKFFDFQTQKKTQVVLLDEEDVSNGFAFAPNQWIVIYLEPSRFQMRGTATWLSNVSAHELTHILTLRKMGLTTKFEGIDASVSWDNPRWHADGDADWAPHNVPAWLAEGLAQYGSMQCGGDTLDSHREMLLHTAWESQNLIPLKNMENYADDSRSSEMIYNQGFHLVDFLYRTYGRDAMNTMMSSWDSLGYSGAFQSAFGASPDEVYLRWRQGLDNLYSESGERTETVSAFGAPYIFETSPVYNSASKTLYYLSSEENDFGAAHLYSESQSGWRYQIQRDVSDPMHMAPDGSLLYPALRIDLSTGAQLSDLYRYWPKTDQVERLTTDLRVVAAVATPRNEVYAILRGSGHTRIAHLQNGIPSLVIDAPPQTEFMDLAASGDSILYVGAVRGNNSDILRLDLRSKKLSPILASAHNERDPFVKDGVLYFSSDADGSYAIYSLVGTTIYRHTPPSTPAFAPFVDEDSLRYSAYTPQGFQLQSQPFDSGAALATLGRPRNFAVPVPPVPRVNLLSYDRTGMELSSYAGLIEYAYSRHEDFADPNDLIIRENPCSPHALLGGQAELSDPEQRNFLDAYVALDQCLDVSSKPYVPAAVLTYRNYDLTPDIILSAEYQSLQIELPEFAPGTLGLSSVFQANGELVFHLGSYLYDAPQIQAETQTTNYNLTGVEVITQSAFQAGNIFGFSFVDQGMDFINQGVIGSVGAFFNPDNSIGTAQGSIQVNAHLGRFLYLEAQANGQQNFGNDDSSYSGDATLAGDMRLPMGLTIGSVGYEGLFLESAFLHVAFSFLGTNDPSSSFLSLTEPTALHPLGLSPTPRNAESPLPVFNPIIPVSNLLTLGLRLKIMTPSSRPVIWNFDWQAPPDDMGQGFFSTSISL